jgi:hypothetical protein
MISRNIDAAVHYLLELKKEIEDSATLTKKDAYDWVSSLLDNFWSDELTEIQCVYLKREMLGEIECMECGATMSKNDIMFRYCVKCHDHYRGIYGMEVRRLLNDF